MTAGRVEEDRFSTTSGAAGAKVVHVGHVLTAIWEGGLERFVLSLARGLPADRFRTTVYCLKSENYWIEEFERHGVRVVTFDFDNRPGLVGMLGNAAQWIRLARRLRTDRVDVLHTHDFFPAFVGRTASLLAGVPVRVTTLHNLYSWFPRWAFAVNRLLARRTGAVVSVSRSVEEFSIEHDRLPREKYRVILNGVDETRFVPAPRWREPIRAELGIDRDAVVIGSIGSLTVRKGHVHLVRGAAELMRRDPRIQIVIFGASHEHGQHCREEVEAAVREAGVPDRVRIMPPRPDPERLFPAFDIYCMPSITEGLSLASVEAMMAGSLCVYSDIGPFREVVEDGETGFLFRSTDDEDLGRVLAKALAVLPASEGMREAARRWAVERFSQARMVAEYARLYDDLLIRRGAAV